MWVYWLYKRDLWVYWLYKRGSMGLLAIQVGFKGFIGYTRGNIRVYWLHKMRSQGLLAI